MKITSFSAQKKNDSRVNVAVDGKYAISLDISQVVDLGLKVGQEVSETDIKMFSIESEFGKTYARALKYCLMRPRSVREIKDYLSRKKTVRADNPNGENLDEIIGQMNSRVLERLIDRGYVNDGKFAQYWIQNRSVKKGISRRRLTLELKNKGVSQEIIDETICGSDRSDSEELKKIVARKRFRYNDDKKFIQYLLRKGFGYDDIKSALEL